jgi:hypothetical protein
VITMPSGVTRSSRARHWALNFAAGMVFTTPSYDWSPIVSTYQPGVDSGLAVRQGGALAVAAVQYPA